MAIGPVRSMRRMFSAAFPERRIYIRTDGRTRYLALGTGMQILCVAAMATVVLWTGFATTSYVGGVLDGHTAVNRIETMQRAYETRIAALGGQQRRFEQQLNEANLRRDAVTERLSDKQARLVETANMLREAEAELEVLRNEYTRMAELRRADQVRIAELQGDLARAGIALAETERSSDNLTGALDVFSETVEQVIAERDTAVAESGKMAAELSQLTSRLGQMEDREERLVAQLQEAAALSMSGLERLFSQTNIDLDGIMTQARRDYTGAGGPFEPLDEDSHTGGAVDTTEGDRRVAALIKDLETVNLMRFAADRLPFGEPVHGGRKTSKFGPRRDPKGRGHSMHAGLDIAAPRGTPIFSTADGVVTFAGRQRGYGIVVKIRHAFGFETVYAHLNRARVKVGQRVARGDRVADMGSTGRSTGTHLHYEVRIDNEPVDPLKFIEAARDVL
ncbi:MAG TPA: DUF5930 domain-containing protein [Thermohalobaculum sp.]|nr:DUF5930 domain-containing protein [Thermohalobaculum sp.]